MVVQRGAVSTRGPGQMELHQLTSRGGTAGRCVRQGPDGERGIVVVVILFASREMRLARG